MGESGYGENRGCGCLSLWVWPPGCSVKVTAAPKDATVIAYVGLLYLISSITSVLN